MVIELSGVYFGLKSTSDFKIERALVRNHKYNFRPKLLKMKLNYHFVTNIQDFFLLNQCWDGL